MNKKQRNALLIEYSKIIQKNHYCKFISRIYKGNVLCATLIQRSMYNLNRSSDNWGNNKFFKFVGPCLHSMYKVGDSWIEELGTTKDKYIGAMKLISQVAKKEADVDTLLKSNALNHLIIRYKGADNITWFYVNEKVLIKVLEKAQALYEDEEKRKQEQLESRMYTQVRDEVLNNLSASGKIPRAEGNFHSPIPDTINTNINISIKELPEFDENDFVNEEIEETTLKVKTTFDKFNAKVEKSRAKEKELTPEQIESNKRKQERLLDNKLGLTMEDTFEVSNETVEKAIEMGYNTDVVKLEAFKFKKYYTVGKGATRTKRNWNNEFIYWLETSYNNGWISKDGKFINGKVISNARKETHEESIYRVAKALPNLFEHITD